MNQTLREYFLQLGEVLSAYHENFCKSHPDFESADAVFLGSVTINGAIAFGGHSSFDSLQGKADRDLVTTERVLELCEKFIEANKG